ncbi:MAG: alpha/beta hydrolase [Gemmatimonadaceae bacterium]|jgi:pimeloyl-ACP methyl ester carboxylesterase|nr:alpha/beta hydrolase [Gemmatimonadaceae bacterium]
MRHSRLARLLLVLAALSYLAVARASLAQPTSARAPITERLAELRRIHTPRGVERLEAVTIGGVSQWINVRGKDARAPVIVMIHGGPGTPTLPTAWAYQAPWEDFFTVVHYDQRGVGKNAVGTDREALAPTLTFDRLVQDAEEVVGWVRRELGVERVVVMGYSYGTAIGLALAERKPEWISAYVGVGQVSAGGDAYLYPRLLELARERNDTTALRELQSIAPYPRPGAPMSSILLTRKWARQFDGGWYGKPTFDLLFALPEWAPEYTDADVAAQIPATQFASRALVGSARPPLPEHASVPVVIIQGLHDLHTPYAPARAWFDRLQAPHKRFVTLEHSAHVPFLEEPGRFLQALLTEVMPLAQRSR